MPMEPAASARLIAEESGKRAKVIRKASLKPV